ncbi:MAG TPA: citryl-CoA lyase [Steroidobacteraceae bacterium]|nr:citryl-CoA lyase [Steroidobacteraceae bacterium]
MVVRVKKKAAVKTVTRTALCGATADYIEVRGRDLVSELIGKLSFTEMFLFHLTGKKPGALQVAVVDAVLVAIMEHGLVPSAIAARLTLLGAPESYQGAIAAGLLGVGDRFAGTASQCAALLDRIVAAPAPEREALARGIVETYRRERRPLPGFGHPTHRSGDPRVPRLLEIARAHGAPGRYIEALRQLETALSQVLGHSLPTNVSSAIAVVLREAELPAEVTRGIVLTARCAGLVGHLLEEMHEPAAEAMWQAVERAVPYRPRQR